MLPLGFFNQIGPMELAIVGFVALLIFGNRLPSVMRSLGKSVTEFKKGVSGIEDEIEQASRLPEPNKSTTTTHTE